MNPGLRITTYTGNTLYFPVRVREHGVKGYADLSAAAQIQVEWENSAGVHQSLIVVSAALPGADWANGLVMLPISPSNFTAVEGTYTFSLTVLIGGQEITTESGVVEVLERPGHPPA